MGLLEQDAGPICTRGLYSAPRAQPNLWGKRSDSGDGAAAWWMEVWDAPHHRLGSLKPPQPSVPQFPRIKRSISCAAGLELSHSCVTHTAAPHGLLHWGDTRSPPPHCGVSLQRCCPLGVPNRDPRAAGTPSSTRCISPSIPVPSPLLGPRGGTGRGSPRHRAPRARFWVGKGPRGKAANQPCAGRIPLPTPWARP